METILYQNQHFGLFSPLGGKKRNQQTVSTIARAISNPRAAWHCLGLGKEQPRWSRSAGHHWSLLAFTETQHISLFELHEGFLQERIKV